MLTIFVKLFLLTHWSFRVGHTIHPFDFIYLTVPHGARFHASLYNCQTKSLAKVEKNSGVMRNQLRIGILAQHS